MSLVRFLIFLSIGTALSWTAWGLVLFNLDPVAGGAIGPVLFLGSLWLALIGTMTLVGFFIRYWFERSTVPFRQVAVAFRQAALLGTGTMVALVLQTGRLFHWWTGLFLLLLILGIEFFFLVGDTSRARSAPPNNFSA